jgi:hypothetical protein
VVRQDGLGLRLHAHAHHDMRHILGERDLIDSAELDRFVPDLGLMRHQTICRLERDRDQRTAG